MGSAVAQSQDIWSDPYPGVRHLDRRLGDPNRVNALIIDLCTPGIGVHVTPPGEAGTRTTQFAANHGLVAAINGGFYNTDGSYAPIGMTVGGGERWMNGADTADRGYIAFGVNNRAQISLPELIMQRPEFWVTEAIGGMPLLVRDGQFANEACRDHFCDRHPRTAVGLDASRRTLILLTVDGRWSGVSRGMNQRELADQMISLGADIALNLDGGGSTTMVLDGQIMNHPSDGSERRVSNHLGISIDPDARLSFCCDVTPQPNPGRFVDVPQGHWAQEAAETLLDEGITSGCSTDWVAFCPDCGVSREAAAVFMQRALDLAAGPAGRFDDTDPEMFGYDAINALAAAGLTSGCSADPPLYCPFNLLTRGGAVTMILRGANIDLVDPTGRFEDVPVGSWFATYAETALEACIVSGCDAEGTEFCPEDHVTRAEFAIILARALELGSMRNCADGEPPEDAGLPPDPVDAFVPDPVDAFVPDLVDAFVPDPVDAFVPDPVDAFVPDPVDALVPRLDAAQPRLDAAQPHPDAARPQPDAAQPRPDAARPRQDASGLPPSDPDADTPMEPDGENLNPGAPRPDSGFAQNSPSDGGCHCRQGGGASTPSALLLLLLAPLLHRRRR